MGLSKKKSRNIKIYFFYPAFSISDQEIIERLLVKIDKSKKNVKIRKIKAKGRKVQEDLFTKYFSDPRTSQLIRRRVGKPPNQLFKLTKTGNTVYLRGVVALEESGVIQWANKPPESYEFLKDFVARGLKSIDELYTFSKSIESEEVDFLDYFEDSEYCEGSLERSVLIPTFQNGSFINETNKWIDAVLLNLNGEYLVIEAEVDLNYTAIGQALCYEKWFRVFKNIKYSKPAILCKNFRKEYLYVCKELGITVFKVYNGNKVKKIC